MNNGQHDTSQHADKIEASMVCRKCCLPFDWREDGCPSCGQVRTRTVETDDEALAPGTALGQGGRFVVGPALGRGGFGITYLAYDQIMGRRVAIKEFFPSELVDRTAGENTVQVRSRDDVRRFTRERDRFGREASTLGQLSEHVGFAENIVWVYDVFDAFNTTYLVMRYVPGKNLAMVVEHGRPAPDAAVSWCISALRILHRLHEMQIVHRDVKPANLMLSDRNRIVILDFGAARAIADRTYTNLITPGFAAPEAFQPGQPDMSPLMDIYSVGATLYFLLAGVPPVGAPHREGGILLTSLKDKGVHVSDALSDCVGKALALERRRRFRSAEAFADALASVPESRTQPRSLKILTGGRSLPLGKRSRLWGGLSIAVLVIVALLGQASNIRTFFAVPGVARPAEGDPVPRDVWEQGVRLELVGTYDQNHSRLLDTPTEMDSLDCNVFEELEKQASQAGIPMDLVVDYHFGPTGEFLGHRLGFGERVRGRVYRALLGCGLVSETGVPR